MKMFYASLVTTMTLLSFGHASSFVSEEESFADTPVSISVACTGGTKIDWSKLSLAELTLAGHALVESYNTVHASNDNDDSQLFDLTFNGNGSRRLQQVAENLQWKHHPITGTWRYISRYHKYKVGIMPLIVVLF